MQLSSQEFINATYNTVSFFFFCWHHLKPNKQKYVYFFFSWKHFHNQGKVIEQKGYLCNQVKIMLWLMVAILTQVAAGLSVRLESITYDSCVSVVYYLVSCVL